MATTKSTLHDVAARVGVSTRTVSRVVNGEGGFSAATEARVRAAISELGYRPDLVARSLVTRRTQTIGLVGGAMTDPFFPEVAEGVHEAASQRGLTMLFAATDDRIERQGEIIDSLRSRSVDGIILFPAEGGVEPLLPLVQQGLRLVAINPATTDDRINSISSAIEAGARTAVDHLRSGGCRRIVFIGNAGASSVRRELGYREAAGQAEPRIVEVEPTADGGRRGTQEALERWPDIDGIFAYNDLVAMAALRVLDEADRAVPDDIAVIGFDNIGLSAHLKPPLSTVDLDQGGLGRRAVELLTAAIEEPDGPARQLVHPTTLEVRSSTRATGSGPSLQEAGR